MIVRRVLVSGRVQGVGFRAAAERRARSMSGLRGYVRNLPDGRVEAVFAGAEDSVLAAVAWCKQGPPSSKVLSLEVFEEAPSLVDELDQEFEVR